MWAVNHDILSLRVKIDNTCGFDDYYAYNVDVKTGKRLSNEELIESCGMNAAAYYQLAGAVMDSCFRDQYGDSMSPDDSFFLEQLNLTIAQENIKNAKPYLNGRGELCIIARIYSLAGAEWYWHDLNTAG